VRDLNEAARDRMRAGDELGDDVLVKTERGDRDFASGDRIMFLRNERSLEVKNGTLGTVERVSQQSMTVRTDDGRSVAFDTKDYAHIDHGYAATIHKAQGMTVDRSHVLATPGIDRHGAYVGLSRHRDGMALHYGRDDFKDQSRLVGVLSRERTKDMASDYAKADPVRQFAERRGISIRERLAEMAKKVVPVKIRSIFAGFKPAVKRASVERTEPPRTNDMRRAVERYARAQADIDRMTGQGYPILAHQRSALDKAGAELDAVRPHGRADLAAAFERQPDLVGPTAQGNSPAAIRAMNHETEVRIDPGKRADRFTENWQQLRQQRDMATRKGAHDAARHISGQMGAMAKSLERDAQVESILSARKASLGIDMRSVRPIAQDLADIASLGRSRSLGIGIGM
jgi:hypothetical protein